MFKFKLLILLVSILVGVFLVAQWRAKPSRITDSLLPYTSLRDARNILQNENDMLKKQISRALQDIDNSQELLKQARVSSVPSLDELERLKDEAALKPEIGEGVKITLEDSSAIATYDSIVHAADIRDLMNLLWASGARAVAINNKRVSLFTSVDCIVNTILINNARLGSPFLIQAIGDPKELKANLENPSLLSDIHNRKKYGLKFEVKISEKISVPAFDGSYAIEFSKIKQ